MIICDASLCCGCGACSSVCTQSAITLLPDEKGFYHPLISSEKCIECKACQRVCPVLSEKQTTALKLSYACFNNDNDVLKRSSSGGVFSLLAERIIDDGGVVFGAAFDDIFSVRHICVDKKEDIYKLCGSKYLQSKITDSYIKAKEYLEKGKPVLFTGTPCQINGLKSFLKKDYDNLYLQDIICHSTPSEKVWKTYIAFREKQYGGKLSGVSFRDKTVSWQKYSLKMNFSNGKEHFIEGRQDPYMKAFISGLSIRSGCTNCVFKGENRGSDITLADFWGAEAVNSEVFCEMGTSLVIVNSLKGEKLFNKICDALTYEKTDIDKALQYNTAYYNCAKKHPDREEFFSNVNDENFEKLVKKYNPVPFKERFSKTLIGRALRSVKRWIVN